MSTEARETLIIDQFVLGLNTRDLRRHVQFNHPATLQQAITLANEFEFFESASYGRKPEDPSFGIRSLGEKSVPSPSTVRLEKEIKSLRQELSDMKRFNNDNKFKSQSPQHSSHPQYSPMPYPPFVPPSYPPPPPHVPPSYPPPQPHVPPPFPPPPPHARAPRRNNQGNF